MIRSIALVLLASVLLSTTSGCIEKKARAQTSTHKKPDAPPQSGEQKISEEALTKPIPSEISHDPRAISAGSASEEMTQTLQGVRKRFTDLKTAFDTKPATEEDFKKIVDRLRKLLSSARDDCDATLRLAKDLKVELRFAKGGYMAVSDLYRERAQFIRDKDLKDVNLKMAAELERLAEDVPRRMKLTETFIDQLLDTQEFLAETERCLKDTNTALIILSAGPEPVKISEQGRVFRRQLETFLKILEEYQEKLLRGPRPLPDAKEKTEPPPALEKGIDPAQPEPQKEDAPLTPKVYYVAATPIAIKTDQVTKTEPSLLTDLIGGQLFPARASEKAGNVFQANNVSQSDAPAANQGSWNTRPMLEVSAFCAKCQRVHATYLIVPNR